MKFKFLFLISVIMLVLSFSSSFAFTVDDIKTLSYNWFVNAYNFNETVALNYVSNYDYSAINDYVDNSDYYIIAYCNENYINSSGNLYICVCKKKSQNPYMYQYQTIYNRVMSVDLYYLYNCGSNNNMPYFQVNNTHNFNYDFTYLRDNNLKVIFSQVDIYNQQYSSIWWNAGDYTPSWLFENVSFNNFEIIINTVNDTQYVDINVDTGNTLEDIPIIYTNNFGTLYDDTYVYYIDDLLGFWYWTGNSWTYKVIYNRSQEQVLLKSNNYLNINYDSNNNNESASLTLNNLYSYKNVLYHFSVTNADFDNVNAYFIIGDNNTNVVNGTLVISGDYFNNGTYNNQFNDLDNQINNNDNTQDIINSITNIDNVDENIDNFLSGDVNSWSFDIGYSPIENPFSSFLYDLILNVYSALTERGNVVLNLNHHGTTNWVINTSEFVTPDSPVKTLVKWCLVFLWIYGNYKYFHYLISIIQTARIDKAIAELGTDEFYDSDIM